MITPYATLRTNEDLLSNSRGIDCIMDSIVSNTLTCANKCIDPFEDYYIEMSPNRAPIVGMYVKQRHLYSRIIESSKKGDLCLLLILQRIFYECFIKMKYLIIHGETAQHEYRLLSYKDRYKFYEQTKDEDNIYFKSRNAKFLKNLQDDGFSLDDLKPIIGKKAFGGKTFRDLVRDLDDDRLYTSLYGILSDPIHSDWGEISQVYLCRSSEDDVYVPNLDIQYSPNMRFLVSACDIMIDSSIYYIEWIKDAVPALDGLLTVYNEMKRVVRLYNSLEWEEYK